MAKKIEGMAHQYAERNLTEDGDTRLVAGDSFSATRPGTMYTMSGTLVIHDGVREPVYTETEIWSAIERRIDALPDTLSTDDYQRIRDVLQFLSSDADVMGLSVHKADHA